MSLLNQVLRDLQGRKAPLPQSRLAASVRPVHKPGGGKLRGILFFLVIGGAFFGGFYAWSSWTPQQNLASRPVTQTPVPVAVQSAAPVEEQAVITSQNRLVTVRLREGDESMRLLLEFSRPLVDAPQVFVDDGTLKILLTDLEPDLQPLPRSQRDSPLVENLNFVFEDHLWQLHARLTTDVQIQQVRLAADDLYGQRLAIDIFPQVKNIPIVTAQLVAPPEAKVQPTPPPQKTLGLAKARVTLTPAEEAQKSYRQGLAALEKGQAGVAESLWRQALRLDSTYVAARKALIELLIVTDRKTADDLFNQGLRLHEPLGWRIWYAHTLLQAVSAAEAVQVLEDAVLESTADLELLALRAGLWQQIAEYQRAQQDYLRLTQLDPGKGLYRFGLAVAFDQLTDPGAVEAYSAAIKLGLKPQLMSYAQDRLRILQQRTGG